MNYQCRQCNLIANELGDCPTCNIPMQEILQQTEEQGQPEVAPEMPATESPMPEAPAAPVTEAPEAPAPEAPAAPEMPEAAPSTEGTPEMPA